MTEERDQPSWSFREGVFFAATTALAAYAVDDWIGGAAVCVLWIVWKYLRREGGIPVLAMALTFQWTQVTAGLWYFAVTGRRIDTMILSDYRPMVLIGLGCVLALALGLRIGSSLASRWRWTHSRAPDQLYIPIGWPTLVVSYLTALALQGVLQRVAYDYPGLTQPILAMRFVHLAILFIILRRLSSPVMRWQWLGAVILLEVALGLTGFFAGFREPLVMAALALYEGFDPRRTQHWIVTGSLVVLMVTLSIMWMNVRVQYRASFSDEEFAESRQARMDEMVTLATNWWRESHDLNDLDKLVDRVWAVYYPALAVSRVPSVLPHTDGALMMAALQHVFNPRLFFPTKVELQSDSEMVRKYSGVYVAGAEQNTSIAFGYAAESYLDFGLPLMFVPVLLFGIGTGIAYRFFVGRIAHHEIRTGLVAVIFWLTLYLFERSWVKTLGLGGTLMIYIGGPALLIDYYFTRTERRLARSSATAAATAFDGAALRP